MERDKQLAEAIERIRGAQGYRHIGAHVWNAPSPSGAVRLPDPLTDWSAFGEILEWADREGFEWFKEGDIWKCHHFRRDLFGSAAGPEREARLAALSEAVRE